MCYEMSENTVSKNYDFQIYLNDYATRSFRDIADQDYILARVCYRRGFDENFKWNSLQAIEKFLKAILLFNRLSAKGLGHDLCKAYERVVDIKDLGFELEQPQKNLINFLNSHGRDRYLSQSTYLKGEELLELDRTVWSIRRYCYFMRQTIKIRGREHSLFENNKEKITSKKNLEAKQLPQIQNGLLEKIISKRLPGYEDLVWKNFCYGRRRKKQIKNFTFRGSGKNPTHTLHPEIFSELCTYVDFPKEIRNQFSASVSAPPKKAEVRLKTKE